MEKTANRLKQLRESKGLTLDDIEKNTGIKRGTYNNYENEKTMPSLEIWNKLAKFFGVSTAYLMGIDDEVDSSFVIKELENRNTKLIKEVVSHLKEIQFLCKEYPDAERKLEQFERERHIKNGYVAGIKEGAEGEDCC